MYEEAPASTKIKRSLEHNIRSTLPHRAIHCISPKTPLHILHHLPIKLRNNILYLRSSLMTAATTLIGLLFRCKYAPCPASGLISNPILNVVATSLDQGSCNQSGESPTRKTSTWPLRMSLGPGPASPEKLETRFGLLEPGAMIWG